MAISSPGVGSNLDVNSIVSQLMAVEKKPLTKLAQKEAGYQAQISAYGNLKGALASFQSTVNALSAMSKFQAVTATPADATVLTASASSSAVPGTYSLNISKLAQAQSLVATGQASMTTAVGAAVDTTLTFDFGTISGGTFTAYDGVAGTGGTYAGSTFTSNGAGVKTVTISSTNNSLQGIRDAINNAKIGVTATIVNDGGATPYRLALSTDSIGKTNSMKISVSGDATVAGLLGHDPAGTQNLKETVTAQNAEFTVNGLFVSKASNSITDVIQGVTLNLAKITTSATTLTVARDTASVTTSVNAFVKAYNDLSKTLTDLTSYNPTTKQAGLLHGDSTARTIQNQLRSMLGSSITGMTGSYSSLSQIGITTQQDGTLVADSTKLQNAINTNFNDIAGLFAEKGSASDSLINYNSATTKTKPGSYAVTVSQLATQGNLAGSAAAGLTITAGVNDTLDVTVDGVSATVTLAAGTYTAAALATEAQSKINGASAFSIAGILVAVTQTAGTMTLASNRYGSASNVAVAGNGATNLLGSSPTATAGVDAAGTINGSAATGSGQYLTGATGNDAEGLKIQVAGGALGERGTVSYSHGYAYKLGKLADTFLATTGSIGTRVDGINKSIADIGHRRDSLNLRLAKVEQNYRAQFTALDVMIANMTKTSNFLTQQLASISNLSKAG